MYDNWSGYQLYYKNLSVIKSPDQGDTKKILTVCSAGIIRSATSAHLLSSPPYNFNTRCAGSEDYALIRVSEELLTWADEVIFMTQGNYWSTQRRFPKFNFESIKKLLIWGIPDDYKYREPDLIKIILEKYKETHEDTIEIN